MRIDELITARDIVTYWETKYVDTIPMLGEVLFSNKKVMGMEIEWAKGANNTPVALKPSQFDVKAPLRDRRGFETMRAEMAFFREGMVVKEADRQRLMQFIKMNDPGLVDMVLTNLYDDKANLISGAKVQRERMIMQLLSSGRIGIEGENQSYEYDYQMDPDNLITPDTKWDQPTANIFKDISDAQKSARLANGAILNTAICNSSVWNEIYTNESIVNDIKGLNTNYIVTENDVKAWFKSKLNLNVVVYDKIFEDEEGLVQTYFPDGVFTLIPEGQLGEMMMGTTPEEADGVYSNAANVAITDTGVAVTTQISVNPVHVETIVSMIALPSFPRINDIRIIKEVLTD